MTDEEKQAIQIFEFFLDDISENGGCTIDIDFQHKNEYESMWKVLNLIEKQQNRIKELETALIDEDYKHRKVINAMASFIASQDIEDAICEKTGRLDECDSMACGECENCIIKYFSEKVEDK